MIIDDEELARDRLRDLCKKHHKEIVIIDEAKNGIEALEKINRLTPDLVFLDIKMPGLNGLELAKKVSHRPVIIFTTAYDDYAIEAFSTNAIEYLLKPVQQEAVDRALEKLRSLSADPGRITRLYEYIQSKLEKQYISRITCKIGSTINLINVQDIYYIQSEDKYSNLYTEKGVFPIETPIVDLEKNLDPQKFVKIHRSTIVNFDFVETIKREDESSYEILLKDKTHTKLQASKIFAPVLRSIC
jgi:two-component system LytT family response regulator